MPAIPDTYDVIRWLLGILIFCGMAAASYGSDHVIVDLMWRVVPGPGGAHARRVFPAGRAKRHGRLHLDVRREGDRHARCPHRYSFDLRQPVWPNYRVVRVELAVIALLLMLRMLVFAPFKLVLAAVT